MIVGDAIQEFNYFFKKLMVSSGPQFDTSVSVVGELFFSFFAVL